MKAKIRFLRKFKGSKVKDKFKIPVEVYSRVVGYYRPVSEWNIGKKEEFQNRLTTNKKFSKISINREY